MVNANIHHWRRFFFFSCSVSFNVMLVNFSSIYMVQIARQQWPPNSTVPIDARFIIEESELSKKRKYLVVEGQHRSQTLRVYIYCYSVLMILFVTTTLF